MLIKTARREENIHVLLYCHKGTKEDTKLSTEDLSASDTILSTYLVPQASDSEYTWLQQTLPRFHKTNPTLVSVPRGTAFSVYFACL